MANPIVQVRLTENQVALLDELAAAHGYTKGSGEPNRSEMLRHIITHALEAQTAKPDHSQAITAAAAAAQELADQLRALSQRVA